MEVLWGFPKVLFFEFFFSSYGQYIGLQPPTPPSLGQFPTGRMGHYGIQGGGIRKVLGFNFFFFEMVEWCL